MYNPNHDRRLVKSYDGKTAFDPVTGEHFHLHKADEMPFAGGVVLLVVILGILLVSEGDRSTPPNPPAPPTPIPTPVYIPTPTPTPIVEPTLSPKTAQ